MNLDKGGNWDVIQGINGDDVVKGCYCSNIRLGTGIRVGKEGGVNGKGAGGGAVVLATKGGAEGQRATGGVAGIGVSMSLIQLQMIELAVTGFEANTLSRNIFCSLGSHLACSSATDLCWRSSATILVFAETQSLFAPTHAHVTLVSVQAHKLVILAHAPKHVVLNTVQH